MSTNSKGSQSGDLSAADLEHCTQLLVRGSKSFPAATRLLPPRVRPRVTALYAFCRVADDAIDGSDEPVRSLEQLTGRVDAVYERRTLDDPVDRALAWVVEDAGVPRALIDALLEGFAWDTETVRFERIEQTLAYAARVASVVGVMMTLIMGGRERSTLARACDLGAAMQLTNIARDVGEDAGLGRLYLPGQWLREEGIDPDAFMRDPRPEPGVRAVVRRVLARATTLYTRSRAGISALPRDCRPGIHAAALIYEDIGRVIAAQGYDSVTGRASTSTARKLLLLARARLLPPASDDAALREPVLPEAAFLVDAVVG